MEVNVLNISGAETGRKIQLPETIFGIEPNDHAIYLDVKQYRANLRQGTHSTKGRSQISGSTRKLFRQKGTGGARRGDIKSPLMHGGGTVFGPQPRSYAEKVNKKVKRLARLSALSYKAKNNEIIVVEDFSFAAPKTKEFAQVLNNLKVADKRSLFALNNADKSVYLSARNIQGVSMMQVDLLNTYKIVESKYLVITESALARLAELLNA
ncbi:50S ribosomal protein L4 [Porphyromonas cangingivalis]|uniref:Large ribosomal subunit protein uL4 n=1 Tax=Porphyromonas cangingivalis TaxID=36874 RepID=A0A099WUY9_PORCN|nr:50S ribosomal protein L4 [Porphyromonas cangingivalis]KGL47915.1 50S ribosomal protein L4 [Porphyromonas cangingivalis]KGN80512.1 50S ribosomal protein L4 [Porphyromonas cangingivalis]SJZ83553.1 LSU ribosomal protein L4P [Porphyromonas cangingivalis]SPY35301.1 50S ribosomal protein L4 [Porphyromonas cangingivalis]VEJ03776.1 50S ribosomal protein L4 [Porphyromonas cangingivalis]